MTPNRTYIIAHRGASAEAPENTLQAFHLARKRGADGVELDVRLCHSGEVVVLHDETLERTSNGHGRVDRHTLAELRALRLQGGERLPTLAETLAALAPASYCFIEIKALAAAVPAARLAHEAMERGYAREKLWLISFDAAALASVRAAYPALQLGINVERLRLRDMAGWRASGMQAVLPRHARLMARQIAAAHDAGLRVIPWTVNHPRRMKTLSDQGVDGIITDVPHLLAALRAGKT